MKCNLKKQNSNVNNKFGNLIKNVDKPLVTDDSPARVLLLDKIKDKKQKQLAENFINNLRRDYNKALMKTKVGARLA